MFTASVMPSNHLILWPPLLLLPLVFPSIRDFPNELTVSIRWSKYWSFSFSINPSSEYSGLISLKIDWFDLLAVQGTLRSLQHHSAKASIFGVLPSLWPSSHNCMWPLRRPYLDYTDLCWQNNVSAFQHYLGLSSLSCQEAITWFHGFGHCLQVLVYIESFQVVSKYLEKMILCILSNLLLFIWCYSMIITVWRSGMNFWTRQTVLSS